MVFAAVNYDGGGGGGGDNQNSVRRAKLQSNHHHPAISFYRLNALLVAQPTYQST